MHPARETLAPLGAWCSQEGLGGGGEYSVVPEGWKPGQGAGTGKQCTVCATCGALPSPRWTAQDLALGGAATAQGALGSAPMVIHSELPAAFTEHHAGRGWTAVSSPPSSWSVGVGAASAGPVEARARGSPEAAPSPALGTRQGLGSQVIQANPEEGAASGQVNGAREHPGRRHALRVEGITGLGSREQLSSGPRDLTASADYPITPAPVCPVQCH